MAAKRYDIVYQIEIHISSDDREPSDTEVLQALVDKAKYLAVNRSQIDSHLLRRHIHDNESDSEEMPF